MNDPLFVYTITGKRLELKEPPLGKGGEGSVYAIKDYDKRVAKIYKENADAHKEKIEAMASCSGSFLHDVQLANLAWPLAALYEDPKAEKFAGFGMRRIPGGRSLEEAYDYPPQLGMDVPLWQKLAYLISLCDMVERLHEMGQVVGDFNNNNIVLIDDYRVGLVDADSFHVTIAQRTYRCEVCMSGYMAPELIKSVRGSTFATTKNETFTENTDNFALAVHVFRMLFNGVHPFHCIDLPDTSGSLPAPLPIEKRVERGQTPFFKRLGNISVPPFAPDVESLPPYVAELFSKAFLKGAKAPAARPSAQEWRYALSHFSGEVVPCASQLHWYWKALPDCPYCEADARAGVVRGGNASGANGPPEQTEDDGKGEGRVLIALAIFTLAIFTALLIADVVMIVLSFNSYYSSV